MSSLLQKDSHVDGYRVVRLLGKGGMAEVYEVECIKTGVPYALKVFVCSQANAVFLKKRFLVEARLMAKLRHPRLVHVYDFGYLNETESESPYFVMDLVETALGSVDGSMRPVSLKDALALGLTTEERLAGWYGDLLEALDYIHSHNVIHRDVSLENVLIAPDGRVLLSDFGVARVVDRDLRAELNLSMVTMMTEGQPLMGKAFYLAPEVRAGRPATAAADFYALGVMFFYLLNQVWYTPGARVGDMLSLFDEQWQPILTALLTEDPTTRRVVRWEDGRERELSFLRTREVELISEQRRQHRVLKRCAVAGGVIAGLCSGWIGWTLSGHFSVQTSAVTAKVDVGGRDARTTAAAAQADLLCTVPSVIGEDIDNENLEVYLRIRPLAKDLVAEVLENNPGNPGGSLDEKAKEFYKVAEGCGLALVNLLRQAAFWLYLRDHELTKAVAILKYFEEEETDWYDSLNSSLEKDPPKEIPPETIAQFRNRWNKKDD